MIKETVLVVDDEEDILELVRYTLEKEGYRVVCAETGEEALEQVKTVQFDLVVLDLLLPSIDGLEVCKLLKKNPKTERIPIIILSAKGEESDVVLGLELGASDYVNKPFSPRILVARIRSVLRRQENYPPEPFKQKIHELVIDPVRHEVLASGEPIKLTYTEFEILRVLVKKPGQVFTRYQIVDTIRGSEHAVSDRSVDVQIASLRKKLGPFNKYVETVRNVGYRFRD